MFKKLIINLPFSPGLASQVAFYGKRLKQDEVIRRYGLLFVALAMTAQSFMIISPPEAAIAVGPNNIIYSGVTSKEDLLQKYQDGSDGNGHNDIKQIFDHYKINENSIQNSKEVTISADSHDGNLRSIGRYKQGFASETSVPIPGTSTTVYERDLVEWNGGPYKVLEGTRTDGTYFAVIMSCGNILIDPEEEPERPPVFDINVTCDAIVGKATDPDGGVVPLRTWIRVVNETPTTGGWISITGKLPYTIAEKYQSSENVTRVSVEGQDVDTGLWLPVLTGVDVGPCLDPPPVPETAWYCDTSSWLVIGPVEKKDVPEGVPSYDNKQDAAEGCEAPSAVKCTSLKWIETEGLAKITLRATARVENATVQSFKFTIEDEADTEVASETINTSETSATYTVDLENPGTYLASVTVVTDQGENTNRNCQEPITINDPVIPIFEIVKHKEASNITQDIEDANDTTAAPNDIIEYRLFTRNTGNIAGDVHIQENLSDVLEYSKLIESDGAEYFEATGVLDWGTIELQPNQTDIRTIRVQVNSAIAGTSRSSGDLASYDLVMHNIYGEDAININLPCSDTGKCIEKVVQSLPKTGPGASTMINTFLIVASVYFYMRTRQTRKELKLIQSEYNFSAQGV